MSEVIADAGCPHLAIEMCDATKATESLTLPFFRMTRHTLDVSIIGLGNWGTSLAAALEAANISVREVVTRKPRRLTSPTTTWEQAELGARILWLCVPDATIAQAAQQVVERRSRLSGQIVLHSSGALTAAALESVRQAGAKVASIHPAMTFPTRDLVPLQGVYFGIEAEDAATRKTLRALVRKLGGKPFDLGPRQKALYHAAGTLASPLLVSALTAAMEAARHAGMDKTTAAGWVQALAQPTLRNVFSRGPEKSFSGPFARGDAETIRLHLKALQEHPVLATVYRSLAIQAIDTLPVQNKQALTAALGVQAKAKKQGSVVDGLRRR